MKTPEEIKRLREMSTRLKELGVPETTMKKADSWIDKEELKLKDRKTERRQGGSS